MVRESKVRWTVGFLGLFLMIGIAAGWAFHLQLRQEQRDNALTHAVLMGDIPAAQVLLTEGADPNAAWGQSNKPLSFPEFCKRMLHLTNRKTQERMTVLMAECADGELAMVKLLVDSGADVNARDARGSTPLMFAVGNIRGDSVPIITLLVAHHAEINATNSMGQTASQLADGESLKALTAVNTIQKVTEKR